MTHFLFGVHSFHEGACDRGGHDSLEGRGGVAFFS